MDIRGELSAADLASQGSGRIEFDAQAPIDLQARRSCEFDVRRLAIRFPGNFEDMQKQGLRSWIWIRHFDPPGADRRLLAPFGHMVVLRGRFEGVSPGFLT